jgi:hypothetical protein
MRVRPVLAGTTGINPDGDLTQKYSIDPGKGPDTWQIRLKQKNAPVKTRPAFK